MNNCMMVSPEEHKHCGIIEISFGLMPELVPEVTIDSCDTQGHLRDQGVFARVHERLLLPESYRVLAIFVRILEKRWAVLVTAPMIPDFPLQEEYPRVVPTYMRDTEGVFLSEITIERRTRTSTDRGMEWLLTSSVEE